MTTLREHEETVEDVKHGLEPIGAELERQRKFSMYLALAVAACLLLVLGLVIWNGARSILNSDKIEKTQTKGEVTARKTERTIEYLKGERGIPGVPGKNGVKGAPGAPGARGAKGEKGSPGSKGATGQRGPPGRPGTNGTNGTRGEKGEAGPKGEKGDTGSDGAPGQDGQDGEPGATGAQGPQGPPGPSPAGIQSACVQPDGTVQNQVTTDPDGDGVYTCP